MVSLLFNSSTQPVKKSCKTSSMILEELSKVWGSISDNVISIEVILETENLQQKACVTIWIVWEPVSKWCVRVNVTLRFIYSSLGEIPASATGQQNRGPRHLHQQWRPPGKLVQSSLEEEDVVDTEEQQK